MNQPPTHLAWPFPLRIVLVLAFLVLVTEVVCRQWLVSPSTSFVHPDFGLCTMPHSSVVHSLEGYSRSTTNSWGMFDDEPLAMKPALRALLLGDSYVESKQVPRAENFQSVAERTLPGLEVINAGSSSRSMVNYLAVAKAAISEFDPDVLVVVLNDGDIEALTSLKRQRVDTVRARDYTGMLRETREYLSDGESPLRKLARRSALVTYVYRRLKLLVSTEKTRLASKWSATGAEAAEPHLSEANVAAYRSLCEGFSEIGLPVIYLYIPHIDYHDDGFAVVYPERRQAHASVASTYGDGWLDMTGAFQTYLQEHPGSALHGFANSILGNGHLNALGHEITGHEMARAIADLRGAATGR